jgi:hypothetical protein
MAPRQPHLRGGGQSGVRPERGSQSQPRKDIPSPYRSRKAYPQRLVERQSIYGTAEAVAVPFVRQSLPRLLRVSEGFMCCPGWPTGKSNCAGTFLRRAAVRRSRGDESPTNMLQENPESPCRMHLALRFRYRWFPGRSYPRHQIPEQ